MSDEIKSQIRDLLSKNMSPAEIAFNFGQTRDTIMRLIWEMLGRGELRRSDILYSVSSQKREAILKARNSLPRGAPNDWVVSILSQSEQASLWKTIETVDEDVRIVLDYSESRVILGDLYEELREIEVTLHHYIRRRLEEKFGEEEGGWWAHGVTPTLRGDLAKRSEEDPLRLEPYCYTYLLELVTIITSNWDLFMKDFQEIYPANTKPDLTSEIKRLNDIRNMVMHPIKGIDPSENDFEFVREMNRRIVPLRST